MFISFGQNETNSPKEEKLNNTNVNTNSNSNSNVIINNRLEQKEEQPAIELEEAEVESVDKPESVKANKIAKKKYKVYSAPRELNANDELDKSKVDAAPKPAVNSSAYQQRSYGFKVSKKKSSSQRYQRSPSIEQQQSMDDAVGYFAENAPESFEYHYFKYTAGNYDVSLVKHLESAEKLRPDNADVHVQKAAYHMIKNEPAKAMTYFLKLLNSGRLEKAVVTYAEDILLSAPENGTLITHGFDDSYGVWYVQHKKQKRKDVTLVSLDFMQSDQYRNSLKSKGYKIPSSKMIDVDFFVDFCTMNANKRLSVSMTTPKEYLVPIKSKLFVVGLVFEYHNEEYNNFYKNDYLWNEELNKGLVNNARSEKARKLSSNYLPMLLQLRKVYEQRGEMDKMREVDEASDKVGVQCKKYDKVQKLKRAY